jgi:hypothetical protein
MGIRLARKLFGRLGGWIGVRLVQDVPEAIAACEFDCSKPECEGPELLNCKRRMRSEAAEQGARGSGAIAPAIGEETASSTT